MNKASRITMLILALMLMTGVFFYYRLGGFKTPEIKIAEAKKHVIAGKAYRGKMMGKAFGDLFEEAENYIEKKTLDGTVCGIFYTNPENEKDTIDAFIGIILKDTLQKLPEGYSLREIPERKVVQAHIKAHLLVSPFIYPDIEEFAKAQNLELKHVPALEIYPSKVEMIIEVPVK